MNIMTQITGFDESREIEYQRDKNGQIIDSMPKEGSEKSYLILQLPDGETIRTIIADNDLTILLNKYVKH